MADKSPIQKIVLHPLTVLAALGGGVATGLFYPAFAQQTKAIGDIFLLLLKMCVIPILVTSIIGSFGALIQNKDKSIRIGPLLLTFLLVFLCIAVLSLAAAAISGPGRDLSPAARESLGKILLENESRTNTAPASFLSEDWIYDIGTTLVPENIFSALGSGDSLQILFFSIVIGIFAGMIPKNHGNRVIQLCQSLFQVFIEVINRTMYLLPVGLFFIIAYQMSITGVEVLIAMLRYILLVFGLSLLIIFINTIVISRTTGLSFFRSLASLKDPLMVSFGTRSTFASMPVSIRACTRNLKLDSRVVNLVMPIAAVLARFSIVLLYVTAVVFSVQLYGLQFNPLQYGLALGLSILVAVAGAGTPGIVSLSMISIIFIPLQIPFSAIVVLLISIISIIDPVITMANVHTNCMITTILSKRVIR